MTKRRVAVIGDFFQRAEIFVDALRRIEGADFQIRSMELPWPDNPQYHGAPGTELAGLRELMGEPAEIADFIGDAEILVDHLAPITASMLDRLPDLKFIAVSRGGPVNLDMAAIRARGIRVTNTPGRNASAVAEFTIAAILVETRLIRAGHESLRRGIWRGDLYRLDRTGQELSEMTVGIIGYGHIGIQVVRLLKPFGCKILVCDPYVRLRPEDIADGVEETDLDTLLGACDVVSLHARVTEETKGFIGKEQFSRMRPGSYFINTARGPMVDYGALHDALVSRHLRGAMLETFANEPPASDLPLLQLDNVTLTPHIAGSSVKTVTLTADMIAEEVRRYLANEPPLNPAP